jgi:hypothetical protein
MQALEVRSAAGLLVDAAVLLHRYAAVLDRGPRPGPEKGAQRRQEVWAKECLDAEITMADLLASLYRDGYTLDDVTKAFDRMVDVRKGSRLIHAHEYRRVWGYMPPRTK